ncbi:NAPDH-dependent diflavin reductase [Malassezia yamatoensis]|uniref:NAPDH-dependent diflavin reductase n=1 Tax=Malassezia yamatoensis TaxID=253288 RepID=A0AAJ5YWC1_9BASI|nr:NAPDH-dependent diflavin reductase [Malassezia yamatoensis]
MAQAQEVSENQLQASLDPERDTGGEDFDQSTLSSDAETEPLQFDDSASDAPSDDQNLASTRTMGSKSIADLRTGRSDSSDLTDEDDNETDRAVEAENNQNLSMKQETQSSLSDDEMGRNVIENAMRASLEDLASVATADVLSLEQPASRRLAHTTSSPLSSEGEEELAPTMTELPTTPRKGRSTLRRAVMAAAGKRRAAATGGAPSLLVEPDMDSSVPPSAATSRQTSPQSDLDDTATIQSGAEEQGFATETSQDQHADSEEFREQPTEAQPESLLVDREDNQDFDMADTEKGTPVPDVVDQDDDEAIQRRQEAVYLLTKIEIGFAMLRDRLYKERMDELEKESEMIHQGTHPELQLLHFIIDARRSRRASLLQIWLREEHKERDRWAKVEEDIAWIHWRDEAANARRKLLHDSMRKRRRLDREKRFLDTPQPVRRPQPFQAELVRKLPVYSQRTQRDVDRFDYAMQRAPEDISAYMAYPDLRGLDEYGVWMDLEQMGLRSVPASYPAFHRREDAPMQGNFAPYVAQPRSPAPYAPRYAMHNGYMENQYDAPMPMEEYPERFPMPSDYDAPPYGKPHPIDRPAHGLDTGRYPMDVPYGVAPMPVRM